MGIEDDDFLERERAEAEPLRRAMAQGLGKKVTPHILMTPDLDYNRARQQETQARIARETQLVDAHRRGEHPWGKMIRACPLCPKS